VDSGENIAEIRSGWSKFKQQVLCPTGDMYALLRGQVCQLCQKIMLHSSETGYFATSSTDEDDVQLKDKTSRGKQRTEL